MTSLHPCHYTLGPTKCFEITIKAGGANWDEFIILSVLNVNQSVNEFNDGTCQIRVEAAKSRSISEGSLVLRW